MMDSSSTRTDARNAFRQNIAYAVNQSMDEALAFKEAALWLLLDYGETLQNPRISDVEFNRTKAALTEMRRSLADVDLFIANNPGAPPSIERYRTIKATAGRETRVEQWSRGEGFRAGLIAGMFVGVGIFLTVLFITNKIKGCERSAVIEDPRSHLRRMETTQASQDRPTIADGMDKPSNASRMAMVVIHDLSAKVAMEFIAGPRADDGPLGIRFEPNPQHRLGQRRLALWRLPSTVNVGDVRHDLPLRFAPSATDRRG